MTISNQYSAQSNFVKLVDIAGRKIQIRKIGIINLMVILVISLPLFVHKYM